jgi:hypothetical protein
MRGALEVARRVPARVVAVSAPDYLANLAPDPGTVTVVQHSVMWQYMSDQDRRAAQAELDRLRGQATTDAPVARVALEPHRTEDDRDVDFRGPGLRGHLGVLAPRRHAHRGARAPPWPTGDVAVITAPWL